MVVYVFVLLFAVIMFSFRCFAPIRRLAGNIISKMTYKGTLNHHNQLNFFLLSTLWLIVHE